MNIPENMQQKLWKVVLSCVGFLSLFLLLLSINEIRSFTEPLQAPSATDTITVTGEGDALAIPDVATFSFGVTETATTVTDAQTSATAKTNAAIKAMTDAGVASADIQTLSYNINLHYEYSSGTCSPNGICPPSKSTLTGYDVSETIQVKVRDLSKAGSLLQTIGSLGVQNVDSLQFSVDQPEAIQNQARAKAITDAQAKASALAKELGVRLGKVVDFSENNGNVPSPIMYASNAMAVSGSAVAPAPNIPTGQQKVTSDVSITYEIR